MGGRDAMAEVESPRIEPPLALTAPERPLTGPPRSLARTEPTLPAGRRGAAASDFLGGVLAMLLLPLSIVPVLLLGPSVLRAPVALSREAWGEVQRLERSLQPARGPRSPQPASAPGPSVWRSLVSLGPIYGRWSALPQAGRVGIEWTGAPPPPAPPPAGAHDR